MIRTLLPVLMLVFMAACSASGRPSCNGMATPCACKACECKQTGACECHKAGGQCQGCEAGKCACQHGRDYPASPHKMDGGTSLNGGKQCDHCPKGQPAAGH